MESPQRAIQQLSDFVEKLYPILNAPGIAVGLTNRDEILFSEGFGLANRETGEKTNSRTLFQIGSISKSFTSILLLQLQESGLLDIHDPVTKHLPWFEIQSIYQPITLQHLMSHTAGIINGSDESPSAYQETWNLRHTKATAPPGETFHYSNNGYKVLGVVIETLLGRILSDILRERIFNPLGMKRALPVFQNDDRVSLAVGYSPFFDDRPLPAGGMMAPATWFEYDNADGSICANVEDMCRYIQALLKNGQGILSPESFEEFIEPRIPTSDDSHGEHYGLGIAIQQFNEHKVIGHDGGMLGYTASILADLDSGLGVVVLCNGRSDPNIISRFALSLLNSHFGGENSQEDCDYDLFHVANAQEYQGRYTNTNHSFLLMPSENHLYIEINDQSALLQPHSEDSFVVPLTGFDRFPLQIMREHGEIVEAFYGAERYLRDGENQESNFDFPAEWSAYPGYYRTYNPWLPSINIIQQKSELVLFELNGEYHPLYPLEPGFFRVGVDTRSPEYVRFDVIINGKAQFVEFSGGVYSRMSK